MVIQRTQPVVTGISSLQQQVWVAPEPSVLLPATRGFAFAGRVAKPSCQGLIFRLWRGGLKSLPDHSLPPTAGKPPGAREKLQGRATCDPEQCLWIGWTSLGDSRRGQGWCYCQWDCVSRLGCLPEPAGECFQPKWLLHGINLFPLAAAVCKATLWACLRVSRKRIQAGGTHHPARALDEADAGRAG